MFPWYLGCACEAVTLHTETLQIHELLALELTAQARWHAVWRTQNKYDAV
jgi:hypothetical protein